MLGLGPLGVRPENQRAGVGTVLVHPARHLDGPPAQGVFRYAEPFTRL